MPKSGRRWHECSQEGRVGGSAGGELEIGRLERDLEKASPGYEIGRRDGEKYLGQVRAYLGTREETGLYCEVQDAHLGGDGRCCRSKLIEEIPF